MEPPGEGDLIDISHENMNVMSHNSGDLSYSTPHLTCTHHTHDLDRRTKTHSLSLCVCLCLLRTVSLCVSSTNSGNIGSHTQIGPNALCFCYFSRMPLGTFFICHKMPLRLKKNARHSFITCPVAKAIWVIISQIWASIITGNILSPYKWVFMDEDKTFNGFQFSFDLDQNYYSTLPLFETFSSCFFF